MFFFIDVQSLKSSTSIIDLVLQIRQECATKMDAIDTPEC